MKKKITVLDYELPVTISSLDEGGYLARCHSLQGCMAEGETVEDALEIVSDIARNIIMIRREERMEIPLKVIEKNTTVRSHSVIPAFY